MSGPLWPGLLLAGAGAVAFSGKAIIVKLAYRYGVDALTLIMYRMLFALPLFVALSWWASRGRPALQRRDWKAVFGLGFSGYYLASTLDFAGLQFISASLERLILYLTPTLVLLLGAWWFHRSVSMRQLAALAVSYAGVLVVFGQELSFEGESIALGAVLVFASTAELRGVPRRQRRGGATYRLAASHRAGDHRRMPAVHRAVPACCVHGRPRWSRPR